MAESYYRDQAPPDDMKSEKSQQPIIRTWLKTADKKQPVLDFGTGMGFNLGTLKKLGFTKIFAGDISKTSAGFVRKNYPFVKMSALNGSSLPFADNTFKTIVATEVLEHIPQYPKTLKEFSRILKKDGLLLLSSPNYTNLTGLIKLFRDFRSGKKRWGPWGGHCGGFENFVTPLTFRRHLSGFTLLKDTGVDFYWAWFYLLPRRFLRFRDRLNYFPGSLPIFKYICLQYFMLFGKK